MGIPASGKTHLSKKLSSQLNIPILATDKLRKEMSEDLELKKWVNYYWNIDEKTYYETKSCKDRWQDLVNQSEAFWPFVSSKINEAKSQGIFITEGVNLLPHLINKIDIIGVYLVGESRDHILDRIIENPRWGRKRDLQELEATAFYDCEGKKYRDEAEKYGYPVFSNADDAYKYLVEKTK